MRCGRLICSAMANAKHERCCDGYGALREVKAASRRKFDCVLFWALDRFSREGMVPTIMHLQRLSSDGVSFHNLATDNELVRKLACGEHRRGLIPLIGSAAAPFPRAFGWQGHRGCRSDARWERLGTRHMMRKSTSGVTSSKTSSAASRRFDASPRATKRPIAALPR